MNNLFDKPSVNCNKKDHYIWVERYRPSTIDDYIGDEDFKNELKQILKSNQLNHLMLHGQSPGTGKTSAAKLIANIINCDHIYINASDENNVDTVRTKITSFASTVGFNDIKIVILDEADAMTLQAQKALKNTIETYSLHTRFIFTCNHLEKIIDPILSRCDVFEVVPPSKKDVAFRLKHILDSEMVKYSAEDLGYIVNTYYPDMREIINFAQRCSKSGELKIRKCEDNVKVKVRIIELLKKYNAASTFNEIRQLIADNDVKYYEELYQELYDKTVEYAPDRQALMILTIAEYMFQSNMVVNKEITFMACIARILTELKK
jgi:DNA polymerase III delta prime subunit